MTDFAWNVYSTDRVLSSGVIEVAHYEVTATEGDAFVSETFTIELDAPDVSAMTDYDFVTAEQCVAWVQAKLGDDAVTAVQEKLDAKLAAKQTPTKGSGVPW
tara:strand:- start:426 stop:731 length:306 start_codon:yes stop_codon:yes gene_type:complete